MKHTIHLFMWGYQPHFRSSVVILAREVLKQIGLQVELDVLLVGVRKPGAGSPHAVCLEPEDGHWPVALFEGLDADVEAAIPYHPLQNMAYGHEPTMRDKPENIRRSVIRDEVLRRLEAYDRDHDVVSFCGAVYPVDDYYVATVIQAPKPVIDAFPPLMVKDLDGGEVKAAFLRSCIREVLTEAHGALVHPEPGRNLRGEMRSADEVIRKAAASFMRWAGFSVDEVSNVGDLFQDLNRVSSLMYEGHTGIGRLLLTNPESSAIEYVMRLQRPVPIREARWSRKLLQLATKDILLIGNCRAIYGLGRMRSSADTKSPSALYIDFLDHYQWDLRSSDRILLRTRFGEARLPQEPISHERFEDNVVRLFEGLQQPDVERLWFIFNVVARQLQGNMVVIAADAADEARRLGGQGTLIEATATTEELLERASRIDGTIIIDPQGVCHAIGVILDGGASDKCTPSRGARFNSAVRYVGSSAAPRMAIVVSEDRTVDVLPLLRPRVPQADIERALSEFSVATLENYHATRSFLDKHRFYLSAEQCERANQALTRLDHLPKELGQIYIGTPHFTPHPEMNEGYLI